MFPASISACRGLPLSDNGGVFLVTRLRLMESLLNALDRAAARRGPPRPASERTGRRGERAAQFWLQRQGYIVVARDWRSSRARGDLDVVAWSGDGADATLCFVEVKTRTTRAVALAHVAVDEDKRRMIRRMARYYLRQLGKREVPTRFDILSVYFEKGQPAVFEHFPGAFEWAEDRR